MEKVKTRYDHRYMQYDKIQKEITTVNTLTLDIFILKHNRL